MKHAALLLPLIVLLLSGVEPSRQSDEWGYVKVRPGAHMFWWLYKSPSRVYNPSAPWPVVLWLQGGPGSFGTGIGNFGEIGPLDTELKPRNSTWLHVADLLFVDNPVGTGFNFVEDASLLVRTDEQAGSDLTILLKELFSSNRELQRSPLYVVGESYGGIALGNSFISPEDYVFSYASLLKDMSRLDENGVLKINRMAILIKQQIEKGQYTAAEELRWQLMTMIEKSTNGVDPYNLLRDWSGSIQADLHKKLSGLMNWSIRKKLKIIPRLVQ